MIRYGSVRYWSSKLCFALNSRYMHHQYTVEILVGKTWHKIQHHQNYIHLIWDLSVHYWTFQRRQQFMNLFAKKKGKRKTTARRNSEEQMIWEFSVFLRMCIIHSLAGWMADSVFIFLCSETSKSFGFCVFVLCRERKKHNNNTGIFVRFR